MLSDLEIIVKQRHTDNSRFSLLCVLRQQPGRPPERCSSNNRWTLQPEHTSVVGSILGELVFRATQEMRKDGLTTSEKVILTVINPLYVLQNGYR